MSAPPSTAGSPAAASPARYSRGDLVAGKYLLERLIGEGGMGTVWVALNMDLDAPVAIKVLSSETASVDAATRLRREARAEARLEHRAIVRVFDCGETERGDPFIAMELLEGRTLADLLDAKRTLSVVFAIQILLPVIDGLSAAHDAGIVHRDIKPENVFLAQGARYLQPKVVDFGIAKMDGWDPNPSITLQGTVIGSPSYMAPEQARGLSDVDHRADIWAVCAVLYEAVTGRPPFRGDSYNAILRSIVEDEVTPLTRMGDDEAALWSVLERGFAKDRTQRYHTMRELGTALAAVLLRAGTCQDVCGDPIAAVWGLEAQPGGEVPFNGFAGTAFARGSLPTQLLHGSGSAAWHPAPTSTSGVATPSDVGDRRPRAVLLPLVAILVSVGLTATALSMWNDPAPHAAARVSSNEPERKAVASVASVAHVEAASTAPASEASSSTPTLSAARTPPLLQQPVRSKPGKARHGWPQASEVQSPQPDPPTPTASAPREPPSAGARPDAAMVSALGLKSPYR